MEAIEFDHLHAITSHSNGFATAAEGNLEAPVTHCPGWNVADLVRHLTEVHWFWGTIVDERLTSPPPEERKPTPVPDDELLHVFRAGAGRLVDVLGESDPSDHVWTWAPGQQDVAFVSRHQVQEAAVHHWDAVDAAGGALFIEAPEAADAIAEFLTFSVSSEADPADPVRPALDGTFAVQCLDIDAAWTVSDGAIPGTVAVAAGLADRTPALAASASDLLLWLYGRVDLAPEPVPPDLLERFRALCFTD